MTTEPEAMTDERLEEIRRLSTPNVTIEHLEEDWRRQCAFVQELLAEINRLRRPASEGEVATTIPHLTNAKVGEAVAELRGVLEDLEQTIDQQIWPEQVRNDFDMSDDDEVNVNLTMRMVRRISRALTQAREGEPLNAQEQKMIDAAWEAHKAAKP